jgi:antitoxin (DNA-binding transcriptional repressor) of toxin-antitoxin stability system
VRAVGLKVLKNKLSEYVRLAQGGETILVTDRDRVVAELVPPRGGRGPSVSASSPR